MLDGSWLDRIEAHGLQNAVAQGFYHLQNCSSITAGQSSVTLPQTYLKLQKMAGTDSSIKTPPLRVLLSKPGLQLKCLSILREVDI